MEEKKKLKILLATGLFPPDIGGPATFANALYKILPKYNCEVKVATYCQAEHGNTKTRKHENTEERRKGETEKQKNRAVYYVDRRQNIIRRYYKYFHQVWKLSKWADAVYAFDIISVGLPCAIVKLLRPKTKLIVRLGGDHLYETALEKGWYQGTMKNYYKDKRFNARERFTYFINQFVLKLSNRVVFNAEFLRDLYILERGVKRNKTALIKNIRPAFNFDKVEILGSNEKAKLLYIGRLTAVRNLSGLLEAYRSIRSDLRKRSTLEIIGEGPEKERIEKFIEKYNLGDRVKLSGKIPHDKAVRKMAECDILVMPSYTECNAHTIAEASSLKKLMIITKESELYYSGLKDKGLVYIDPLNIDDIRKKMEISIEHAIARELGVIDGMRIIEETTWEAGKVLEKHVELYKGLVNKL